VHSIQNYRTIFVDHAFDTEQLHNYICWSCILLQNYITLFVGRAFDTELHNYICWSCIRYRTT